MLNKRTLRRLIVVLLVLVAVGLAGWWAWNAPRRTVDVVPAERRPIQQVVEEEARTRLPRRYRIVTPFSGRAAPIPLEVGEEVRAGEVVAHMVRDELDFEAAAAQAAVDRLGAMIEENRDVSLEQHGREQSLQLIESLEKAVAAARSREDASQRRWEFAVDQFERTEMLARTDARTQDELDRADLARIESLAAWQQNQLTTQGLQAMEAATRLLPRMVDDLIARRSLREQVLLDEQAEAEARLQQIRVKQERASLESPIDGVVLSRLVDSEVTLPAGTTLLEIGNLDDIEVEADVLSRDALRMSVGMAVAILESGTARPLLEGRVKRISPEGFTKISSLGVEEQRVQVIIELTTPSRPPGLGVDFRVDARIVLEERPDALVIPRSAAYRGTDGRWHAFTTSGGRLVERTIEVGLRNDALVEVVSGLEPGDLVVPSPDASLREGQRVRTRQGSNLPFTSYDTGSPSPDPLASSR